MNFFVGLILDLALIFGLAGLVMVLLPVFGLPAIGYVATLGAVLLVGLVAQVWDFRFALGVLVAMRREL